MSDIPKVLEGCGVVISNNVNELVTAMNSIFDNPELAKTMGMAARQRCVEKYSYNAIRPLLVSVFRKIE